MNETIVHGNVEADRNYALTTGHGRFGELSHKVQSDYVFAASKGHAKTEFQTSSNSEKNYAQRQREIAQKAQSRQLQLDPKI